MVPTLSVLLAISTSPSTVDHVGLTVAQVHLQVHSHDEEKLLQFFFCACLLQGALAKKMTHFD